jgi:hypothetical protein
MNRCRDEADNHMEKRPKLPMPVTYQVGDRVRPPLNPRRLHQVSTREAPMAHVSPSSLLSMRR